MRTGNGVLTVCTAVRRRALLAALAVVAGLAFVASAQAAEFDVTNNADSGAGSLRAAITASNAAGGTNTIVFSAGYTSGSTVTLSSELPVITSNVTINGNGLNPVISGGSTYRPFIVGDAGQNPTTSATDSNTYAVTLQNLSVSGGKAQGGNGSDGGGGGAGLGGAVLVTSNGALTLTNVGLTSNSASGGAGGAFTASISGGGGGMGGNGGSNQTGFGNGGGGLLTGTNSASGNGTTTGGTNGGGTNPGTGSGLVTSGSATGSQGGFGGGGGGAAASNGSATAGAGGFGGGGGGAIGAGSGTGTAGNGGYGGGGGAALGAGGDATGGNGGFGGGGGAALTGATVSTAGSGGFGAGAATAQDPSAGGGGGLGAGGAVYVQSGGTVAITGSLTINGNAVAAGAAGGTGGNGSAFGGGIFFQSTMGTPSTISFGAGAQSISDVIADYIGSGGTNPNSGTQANDQGGSLMLAKTGGGTLTLAGANTYSGGTSVGTGSTVVVTNSTFDSGGNQLSSSIGNGAFAFDGGTLQVKSGIGAIAFNNNATLTANGGTFDANGQQLTWNGIISNASGAGTLTIASTLSGGSVTFTNFNNSYTGPTVINTGATLALAGGSIASSSSVTANGTLDLTNAGFTTQIKTLAGSGFVTLGSYGLYLSAASTEFSGVISGGGGLEIGSGTQTLSGVNTYTNETQIDGTAKLVLKGNGSIANSVVAFTGSGTLDISQTTGSSVGALESFTSGAKVFLGAQTLTITSGATFEGVIQDGGIVAGTGGGVTIATNAWQTFAGANTYTGLTTIASGAELDLIKSGSHIGSISNSAGVINNGVFDISGLSNGVTHASTSIKSLSGTDTSAIVYLGSNNLILTNASGTYAGNIQDGFAGTGGGVSVTSGTQVLTGASTYTGATTVTTGATLDVEGSLLASGAVGVTASGKLMGGGTVGNVTVDATSTFAPGNGTPNSHMTATSLALSTGTQYMVQLNPSTASYASVTGNASIGGAVVDAVWATGGGYISRQYKILSAGSITGTFDPVIVDTNRPSNIKTETITYDAGMQNAYIDLELIFSIPGGLNVNQQNVGNALTNYFVTTGGIPSVFATLSASQLSQASGETGTGSQQTTFDAMTLFMQLLTDPFGEGRTSTAGATPFAEEIDAANAYAAKDPARTAREREALAAVYRKVPDIFSPSWNVWAAGFGGSQTTSGNAAVGSNDTTSRVFGTAVGVDYRFSPNTIAGFALGGGGTNFAVNGFGSGRSDLFQAGAFVRHTVGPAYFTAALAYGWQDITTNRTVTIAGTDQLQARFRANAFSGRIEDGYRFVTPWMGITPYAAAQFTTFDLPAYAEQAIVGVNTFALAYTAKTVTDVRSEIGLRTDKSFAMTDSILTLRGRFAWAHDYNSDRSIGATFQTLPGATFVVNGAAQGADKALTTASAEVKWRSGFSLAGTFEGEFSNNSSSYAGKGVARYQW